MRRRSTEVLEATRRRDWVEQAMRIVKRGAPGECDLHLVPEGVTRADYANPYQIGRYPPGDLAHRRIAVSGLVGFASEDL
jgi:hypothetical protein